MPYIPPEVVKEAKTMDLLTYLKNYDPQELVHFSGNTYTTRAHDSLKISNGKWMWWSQGIGGKSALDYLIKVQGLSFTAAVEQIIGEVAIRQPVHVPMQKKEKRKTLLLPKANNNSTRAVHYLQNRGIDLEIIDFCISSGMLYESYPHHNLVFQGFDKNKVPRYANLRGIGTDFKGEVNGSDKRYSFSIPTRNSSFMHVFESAIDLLSYATLLKMKGKDWRANHLVSLAGVYQPRKEIMSSPVPLALTQYLTEHPNVSKVVLRLDNDHAGRMAINTLCTILPKQYEVYPRMPPKGKDYNDYLCKMLNLPITRKPERNSER